jgi:endonuclease G, mitochondrial
MATVVKRFHFSVLVLLTVIPLLAGQDTPNRNIRFGMPSPAKADNAQREDYLIERPQYVLSYNAKTRTPNWVSWCLHKDDIGKSKRGAFEPDPLLPNGFPKVTTQAYIGSGFDRGHMCPAQDRSSRQEDMDATFYLTNVVPQSPDSNQYGWERLESYCRTLAREHTLYICCGPGPGSVSV